MPQKTLRINPEEGAAIAYEIRAGAKILLSATPPRRVTCRAVCRQLAVLAFSTAAPTAPFASRKVKSEESVAECLMRKNATQDSQRLFLRLTRRHF